VKALAFTVKNPEPCGSARGLADTPAKRLTVTLLAAFLQALFGPNISVVGYFAE